MKKLLTLLLLTTMTCNVSFANIIPKLELGNFIIEDEYPDSDLVEPIINIEEAEENVVIEGSVEATPDNLEENSFALEDCLRIALGNNPRIQSAMQDILAADARIRQVWANYFPQLSWQTGYTRIKQLQLSDAIGQNLIFSYYVLGQITASQMLYDFGVTQNQATIKRLDSSMYKMNLSEVINDVVYQVKDAYYQLLYTLESRNVARDMVDKYTLFYNQAKSYYESGISPKVDVTIAEVNLSSSKLQLIQAENAVDIAIARLNNVMGVPYCDKYTLSEKLRYDAMDITLDGAVNIAREARPEYKIAELRVESALQNLKLIKKSWAPQITVEGQYQIGGRTFTNNYGYNFGGYLNFPMINGMLLKNEIKEAKALHNRQIADSMNTKNNIYLDIQQAYYNFNEKRNQIPVATLGVKQAKENYDLSFGRYKVGVGSPTELKESQVAYRNAMLSYYDSLYQYNAALAYLEKAVGKNLNPKEVTLNKDICPTDDKKKKKK